MRRRFFSEESSDSNSSDSASENLQINGSFSTRNASRQILHERFALPFVELLVERFSSGLLNQKALPWLVYSSKMKFKLAILNARLTRVFSASVKL